MKPWLLLFLFLASTLNARAIFGETFDECVARYGPPRNQPPAGEPTIFVKATFIVMIVFENGKAANLNYQWTATDAPNHSKPITEEGIALLLKANGHGAEWQEEKPTDKSRIWTTKDGNLLALYDKASNALNIQAAK